MPGAPDGGASGQSYRLNPDAATGIVASVRAQVIERNAIDDALREALGAIANVDDATTDAIVFALSGIAGDVRDAPARIDARVARAADAAATTITVIEDGDRSMADQADAAQRTALESRARRFGTGPS